MPNKLFLSALILFLCPALAPSQEKNPAPPVSLAPWVLHAKLTNETAPEYPAFALENHIQGEVFVDVVVDENGKVQTAKPVDCLNCSSILADAAVEAVKKWEYQPTVVDGKPALVSSWVAFRFRLDGPSVEILSKSESSTPAAEPAKITGPRKLRISSGVAEANLIHKVDPQYPLMAQQAHIQGDVVMQCIIDKEGNVANLRAMSGHPVLIQAAIDAVKQWKYKGYRLNGEPVEVETTVTVKFHM
jgi:TonB family protein